MADSDSDCSSSSISEFSSLPCSQHFEDGSSVSSNDTLPVSPSLSPENQSSKPWPKDFPIPYFSPSTEEVLLTANEACSSSGTRLSAKDLQTVLPDILGQLAQTIAGFTAHPSSAHFSHAAAALVHKHPCLHEPGSFNGCYSWIQRLKYKMIDFLPNLSGLVCPELVVCSPEKTAQ